jgi:hypothetical protein
MPLYFCDIHVTESVLNTFSIGNIDLLVRQTSKNRTLYFYQTIQPLISTTIDNLLKVIK